MSYGHQTQIAETKDTTIIYRFQDFPLTQISESCRVLTYKSVGMIIPLYGETNMFQSFNQIYNFMIFPSNGSHENFMDVGPEPCLHFAQTSVRLSPIQLPLLLQSFLDNAQAAESIHCPNYLTRNTQIYILYMYIYIYTYVYIYIYIIYHHM